MSLTPLELVNFFSEDGCRPVEEGTILEGDYAKACALPEKVNWSPKEKGIQGYCSQITEKRKRERHQWDKGSFGNDARRRVLRSWRKAESKKEGQQKAAGAWGGHELDYFKGGRGPQEKNPAESEGITNQRGEKKDMNCTNCRQRESCVNSPRTTPLR